RFAARGTVTAADCSKLAARSLKCGNLTADHDLEIRLRLDPLDQIWRHGFAERPTRDQSHVPSAAGEEHGRLPSGIAAADQRDLSILAEVGLQRRGPIVDRRPLKFLEPLHAEATVTRAHGEHDRARLE